MNIIISNSDKTPIYEQITNQIKELIMNGRLNEGDALPSMRLLAKELRVSMITTKRAYEELEREGFVESVVGKGSFVKSSNHDFIREQNLRDMEAAIELAVKKAYCSGISLSEMKDIMSIMYEENKNE